MDVILRDPLNVIKTPPKYVDFPLTTFYWFSTLTGNSTRCQSTKSILSFTPGEYYHVYNRSPSHRKMFIDPADYKYFLSLLNRYLVASLDVYAYPLIPIIFIFLWKSLKAQSSRNRTLIQTGWWQTSFANFLLPTVAIIWSAKHMARSSQGRLNEFKLLMIFTFHRWFTIYVPMQCIMAYVNILRNMPIVLIIRYCLRNQLY